MSSVFFPVGFKIRKKQMKSYFVVSVSSCYGSLQCKVYAVDPFGNVELWGAFCFRFLNIFLIPERERRIIAWQNCNCRSNRNNHFLRKRGSSHGSIVLSEVLIRREFQKSSCEVADGCCSSSYLDVLQTSCDDRLLIYH